MNKRREGGAVGWTEAPRAGATGPPACPPPARPRTAWGGKEKKEWERSGGCEGLGRTAAPRAGATGPPASPLSRHEVWPYAARGTWRKRRGKMACNTLKKVWGRSKGRTYGRAHLCLVSFVQAQARSAKSPSQTGGWPARNLCARGYQDSPLTRSIARSSIAPDNPTLIYFTAICSVCLLFLFCKTIQHGSVIPHINTAL